jgi:hypothetical protein
MIKYEKIKIQAMKRSDKFLSTYNIISQYELPIF